MIHEMRIGPLHATVEVLSDHLYVRELVDPETPAQMVEYLHDVERIAREAAVPKVIFDARAENDVHVAHPDVLDARWEYFRTGDHFRYVAVVLPSAMAVARVNMTAVARGAKSRIRGFEAADDARLWIVSAGKRAG